MQIKLSEVEKEYRKRIGLVLLSEEKLLNMSTVIDIAINLFQEIKVKNISDNENPDMDMLLFQYGIYDWGNEWGRHFSIDITRQFIDPQEDEPYQLQSILVYATEPFEEIKAYNCWSSDFASIEDFVSHIKNTDGFKLSNEHTAKSHHLLFEQC